MKAFQEILDCIKKLEQDDAAFENRRAQANETYDSTTAASAKQRDAALSEYKRLFDAKVSTLQAKLKRDKAPYEADIKKLEDLIESADEWAQKHHLSLTRAGVARKADIAKLINLRWKLLHDSPAWMKAANVVTLGGFKRDGVSDYYHECSAGINWCKDKLSDLERAYTQAYNTAKADYDAKVRQKNDEHAKAESDARDKKRWVHGSVDKDVREKLGNPDSAACLLQKIDALANKTGAEVLFKGSYTPATTYPEYMAIRRAWMYPRISTATYEQLMKTPLKSRLSGSAENKCLGVPFVVPFGTNIVWEYDNANRETMPHSIQRLILRFIRSMPLRSFEVMFFDPIGRGGSLGELVKLTNTEPHNCPIIHDPATTKSEVAEQLKALVDRIDAMNMTLANVGTIADYNRTHTDKLKYTLVILQDFPEGIDTFCYDYLKVITSAAAKKCGVITVFATNKKYIPEDDRFAALYREMKDGAVVIEPTKNSKEFYSEYGGTQLRLVLSATPLSADEVTPIYNEYVHKIPFDNSVRRVFPLGKKDPWIKKTGLQIPFAVDPETNEIVEMELGGDQTSFAMLTGTQGSGKTTTLHALIMGLITNYHPDDVELWLVDYKTTDFSAAYRGQTIPHLKYLIMQNAPECTYGILDKIEEEFGVRRAKLFNDNGVAGVYDYNQKREEEIRRTGRTDMPKLPHIVLIMDEVSHLADHLEANAEYKHNFTRMIQTYREFGFRAVFANQYPIAHDRGIVTDAQDLIRTRLAMSGTLQNMKETLELPSTAMYDETLLRQMSAMLSGDIIYKFIVTKAGGMEAQTLVKKYRAAFVRDEKEIHEVIRRVNARFPAGSYGNKAPKSVENLPREKRDPAVIMEFARRVKLSDDDAIGLYLGTPADFETCFRMELAPHTGENMLVISSDKDMRLSVVMNSIRSFQSYKGNKTVILAHTKDKLYRDNRAVIDAIPTKNPDVTVYNDFGSAWEFLYRCSAAIKEGNEQTNTLVVFLGLDEWLEDLAEREGELVVRKTPTPAPAAQDLRQQLQNANDSYREQSAQEPFWNTEEGRRIAEVYMKKHGDVGQTEIPDGMVYTDEVITMLLKRGPRRNVYSLVTVSTVLDVRHMKLDTSLFKHKFVGAIARNDAIALSVPSEAIKAFERDEVARNSLLYSDGGADTSRRFRPYSN